MSISVSNFPNLIHNSQFIVHNCFCLILNYEFLIMNSLELLTKDEVELAARIIL
ncbi:MAG: hypothetical protein J6Y15_01470 [Bacteroidaceae bacterium]|nr:hypothetical protein [Bacteroidaceae bacterium]